MMQTLSLNVEHYLKNTVVEFRNGSNIAQDNSLIGSVYQALKSKVDVLVENFADELRERLSTLIKEYKKRQKKNPTFLSNFSQSTINEQLIEIGTNLLLKNPSIIVAEPTADDTLFFTAKYGEKTCYVEVYFEENETPTCVMNIFENKKMILNRVGTIQNVMNSFLSLEPTFTA